MIINPWIITVAIANEAARQLPAGTLGWDRMPLCEKDRRLYGLRRMGYEGWIDNQGYAITNAECELKMEKLAKKDVERRAKELEAIGLFGHARLLREGRVS